MSAKLTKDQIDQARFLADQLCGSLYLAVGLEDDRDDEREFHVADAQAALEQLAAIFGFSLLPAKF